MTAFDKIFPPLAYSLLSGAGRDITYSRKSQGVYDMVTRQQVTTTSLSMSVKGLFVTPEEDAFGGIASRSSPALAVEVTRHVIIAGKPFADAGVEPQIGDELRTLTDSTDWKVMKVTPTYSGELVAIYTLEISA